MIKSLAICATVALILFGTQLAAEDTLFIFKEDGKMPQVEAAGVDRYGAAAVHDLLGEDYVVFHGSRAALSATSPLPIEPIDPETIPDDDPLPICQCPEDYRVGLTERFSTPVLQDVLRHQRSIVAPDSLPLEVDQIRALEQMIQQNGPMILQGQ